MDEASELCDLVAIINHGKVVTIDTPERLRIGAGGFHVVEIGFEKPVPPEMLSQLPNVRQRLPGIKSGFTRKTRVGWFPLWSISPVPIP
jgi:ABC-type multidrug transport system ATPase subunit